MGSDLAMESASFRPRPNKGEWVGDELHILVDRFYHGYELLWKGPVTADNESLVKVMLPGGIPPKPEPLPNRDDLLDGILNRCADIEAVGEEAVEIAIDATLRTVVELLNRLGRGEAAEEVEAFMEG